MLFPLELDHTNCVYVPVKDCLNVVHAFSIAVPGDCPLVNVCEKVPPTPVDADIEGVIDTLGVTEGVLLTLGVTLGVIEGVVLILGVTLGVTLIVIDGVLLAVGVTVMLGVRLGVTEGVTIGALLSSSLNSFNPPPLLLLNATIFPVPFVLLKVMDTNQLIIFLITIISEINNVEASRVSPSIYSRNSE